MYSGSHNVICHVCGRKIKAKDAVIVRDKYNTQNNLIVCKRDYDPTHPFQYPFKVGPEKTLNPREVSPDSTPEFFYALTADDMANPIAGSPTDRTASAPLHLRIISGSPGDVRLIWEGPYDVGSGSPTGYRIQRESPVGGGFSTLETTTVVQLYYIDTTTSASTEYNYQVAAVNSAGVGDYSETKSVTTGSETLGSEASLI